MTSGLAKEKRRTDVQDSVLFCLATDLGSKATGEWEKEPFVQGWAAMPGKWVQFCSYSGFSGKWADDALASTRLNG